MRDTRDDTAENAEKAGNAEDAGSEARLADGRAPATPQDLFVRLDALGIAAESFEHPALRTVEEAKALRGELAGAHIKNLILHT